MRSEGFWTRRGECGVERRLESDGIGRETIEREEGVPECQGRPGGAPSGKVVFGAERHEDRGTWERAGGGTKSQNLSRVGPGRGLWLERCAA